MPMNRIQFQPGVSLADFIDQHGTEAACARALRRARWPRGFVCPRCAGRRYSRCANRHGERLWQCAKCRHQTSLISDTLFASTKMPLTRWLTSLRLLKSASSVVSADAEQDQHGRAGADAAPGRVLSHGLACQAQDHARHGRGEAGHQLGGIVTMDDAYRGGSATLAKPGAVRTTRSLS